MADLALQAPAEVESATCATDHGATGDSKPLKASASKTKKTATKPRQTSSQIGEHPKYSEMIASAISHMKERGGSSRQAILKYILNKYNVGKEEKMVNARVKVALKAGVKIGNLKQSKGTGASGSFRLADKRKAMSERKPAKPKAAKVKKPTGPKAKAAKSPKKATAKKAAGTKKTAKNAKSPKKAKSPAKKPAKQTKAAKSPKKDKVKTAASKKGKATTPKKSPAKSKSSKKLKKSK